MRSRVSALVWATWVPMALAVLGLKASSVNAVEPKSSSQCVAIVREPATGGDVDVQSDVEEESHRKSSCVRHPDPGYPHCTGLIRADPSKYPWMKEVKPGEMAPRGALFPTAVRLDTQMPAVGDQGMLRSCVAWAVGYYHLAHLEWKLHHWSLRDHHHLFSPAFIFNQVNQGMNEHGATFPDAMALVCEQGCCNLLDFPYNGNLWDSTSYLAWPSESAYLHAIPFRAYSSCWFSTADSFGINLIKQRLVDGFTTDLGIIPYKNFEAVSDYNYNYTVAERFGTDSAGDHAIAIVGYDDTRQTADGYGAFRCVNSWGLWGDRGYFWMSYKAVSDTGVSERYATYLEVPESYQPTLLGRVQIDHSDRDHLMIRLGVGSPSAPLWYKDFRTWEWTAMPHPFPDHKLVFDMSEGDSLLTNHAPHRVFLRCQNDTQIRVQGHIVSFSAERLPWCATCIAVDTPVQVPDSGPAYSQAEFTGSEPATLCVGAGPEATFPNGARHLVRKPNSEELHVVYQSGHTIYYRMSPDGVTWNAPESLGQGMWPCVSLDYSNLPWVAFVKYPDSNKIYCSVKCSAAPGDWKQILIVSSTDGKYGQISMVCSNLGRVSDSISLSGPDMGYLAFVQYYTGPPGGLNRDEHVPSPHSGVSFTAFDTLSPDSKPYPYSPGWYCYYIEDVDTSGTRPLDSLPCITRTPQDIIHVGWLSGCHGGQTPTSVAEYARSDTISPAAIRDSGRGPSFSHPYGVATPTTDNAPSFPFIEASGDSVFAVWRRALDFEWEPTPGQIWRRAGALRDPYDQWNLLSTKQSTAADSEAGPPVMSSRRLAAWPGVTGPSARAVRGRDPNAPSPFTLYGTSNDVYYAHLERHPGLPTFSYGDIQTALFTERTGPSTYAVRLKRHYVGNFAGNANEVYYSAGVGDSVRSHYCLSRDGMIRYSGFSVDYAKHKLKYVLRYLNPMYYYRARAILYHEGEGVWRQRIVLRDSLISEIALEPGKAETLWFDVPWKLYRDSKVLFSVARVKEGLAVLADLAVYQHERRDGKGNGPGGGQMAGLTGPAAIPMLYAGRPNPFARTTEIGYDLPITARVSLRLFDLSGRTVRTLVSPGRGAQAVGRHSVRWDGRDDLGRVLPEGVYFCRLEVGDHRIARKVVLTR